MTLRRASVLSGRVALAAALAAAGGSLVSCMPSRGGDGGDAGGSDGASAFDGTSDADDAGGDAPTAPRDSAADAGADGGADAATDGPGASDAGDAGDAATSTDSGTGPVSCAHPVSLTSTVDSHFIDMDVDDQFAYWVEFGGAFGDGGALNARVSRVPVDGSGPAVPLWEDLCGVLGNAAFDANNIYLDCHQIIDGNRTVEIITVPKDGAAPAPLFTADITVPALNLPVGTIGTDGTNVYFSCCSNTGFYSIPVGGGVPTRLTPDPQPATVNGFFYITASAGNVYWQGSYHSTGALLQLPTGGGTPAVLANDDALTGPIDDMVFRDSYVYWRAVSAPPALWRLPIAGGTPTMLATFPSIPNQPTGQMTIFGNTIYFGGQDGHGNLLLESYPVDLAGDAGDAGGAGTTTVVATIPYGYNGAINHVVANSTHLFIADPGVAGDGHIYRCE